MNFEERARAILEKDFYNVYDLAELVSLLRSENGCPWDKVQTHESIKNDFLEETYEVIEAIDSSDPDMLKEELGDVLLQVLFHADIDRESGNFNLDDVADGICKKLILRHPHVFGNVKADDTETVLKNWDAIKKEEKHQETYTDTLKSVPSVFPALMKAQKLGKRSSRAREDFTKDKKGQLAALWYLLDAAEKMQECIDRECEDSQRKERCLNDLLFSCCNLARTLELDAETVLADGCKSYIERFEQAENNAAQSGKSMAEIDFADADVLWYKS